MMIAAEIKSLHFHFHCKYICLIGQPNDHFLRLLEHHCVRAEAFLPRLHQAAE